MNISDQIVFSEEADFAIRSGVPVVALESTIISHGMPYPHNLETALSVEDVVRSNGAVPATVAVINGRINIGLGKKELELLSEGKNILKASGRDLPFVVAGGLNAATTVSATMICSSLAGIKIFATGGIGGVHRNASKTFDISADLTELARTDVAVVSAGVKSILDIGLTLEYLETLGVPVLGFGTDEFPAFFSRESGFKVNYRTDTPEQVADVINAKRRLGISGGVLIANPVPEESSMPKDVIDKAIDEALCLAESNGVSGKEITPYLLSQVTRITRGESLRTNIELVRNNSILAARISAYL